MYNQDIFETFLRERDWTLFETTSDPNVQWKCIYDHVIDILSVMCPYKVTSVRKTPTPWITPEIYNMLNQKRILIGQYKITRTEQDLKDLRILRNKLNTTIDRAKSTYITESLHRNCKNPKKILENYQRHDRSFHKL